jgi:hypothetical protein
LLKHPRRPRRTGEWTSAAAVTFIVTLAARQSVTLAARRAGMSRKSAYALKARDPAFAAAWKAAIAAGNLPRRQGDKVDETHSPPVSPPQGNRSQARRSRIRHAELVSASMNNGAVKSGDSEFMDSDLRQNDELKLLRDCLSRDRFFAELVNRRRDSAPLAGTAAAQ